MRASCATGWVLLLLLAGACDTTRPEGVSTTAAAPSTSTTVIAPLEVDAPPTPSTTAAPRLDRSAAAVAQRMEGDRFTLLGIGPRPAGSPAEWDTGDWLLTSLVEISGRPLRANANEGRFLLPSGLRSRNIDAVVEVPALVAPPAEMLLVAHYDSVEGSPGIDDNGSGVIVLLEVARRLFDDPEPDLRVGISFIGSDLVGIPDPTAEFAEVGYGSSVEARRSRVVPDVVLVIDTVGGGGELTVTATPPAGATAETLLRRAAAANGLLLRRTGQIDSSGAAFGLLGIPAATLSRGGNVRAGTAADTAVGVDQLREAADVVETFVRLVAERAG